jgi:1,4-dihydroxy-2-naphthoate octaprenyltransferase
MSKNSQEHNAVLTAKEIFRKHKTLTLITCGEKVWAGKTYYAEENGYIYIALERGKNYQNLLQNPQVFFVIDHNTPDLFLQGEGIAERLGTVEEREERKILFRHAFELVPFVQAFPGVEIFQIRPTHLYISDFRGEWKPRMHLEVNEEVFKILQNTPSSSYSPLKLFWKAVRPFSFTATLIPVFLGGILAPELHIGLFLLTLLSMLFLHSGVNVLSDYQDFIRNIDTWKVLGSSRVLVDEELPPKKHLLLGWALLFSGIFAGILLTLSVGWKLLLFGAGGVFLGIFYTFPPFGLKYRALGDLAVFLAFGPLPTMGSYYVQTRQLSITSFLLSIPIGLLTTGILHGNNYRDLKTDLEKGYKTVAILLKEKGSGIYYGVLVFGSYLWILLGVLMNLIPPLALLACLTFPVAWKNFQIAQNPRKVQFTLLDLLTAKLHFQYGILLLLGILLEKVLHSS